jgi:hypothetical protein
VRTWLTLDRSTRAAIAFEELGQLLADCFDHLLTREGPDAERETVYFRRALLAAAGWLGESAGHWPEMRQPVSRTAFWTVERLQELTRELEPTLRLEKAQSIARYRKALETWCNAHGPDAATRRRSVVYALTGKRPRTVSGVAMQEAMVAYHREQLPRLLAD